jgi:hypothetical protein
MGGDCKPRGDRAGTFEPTYRIDEKSFGWFDQSRHNFDLATLLDSGYIRVSICNHHGSTLSFIISTKPLCFEVPCYISSPLPVSLTPALLCLFFRRGAARLVPRAGLTAVHGIYATIVFIYLRHVFIFISSTSLFAILP